MPGILSSRRRRARRLRAAARLSWHLHRIGLKPLSFLELKYLRLVLASHHSADPHFLHRITVEMEGTRPAPWKCKFCRRMNKHNAILCGQCGRHWTFALDESYTHQPRGTSRQQEDSSWSYTHWDEETPWKNQQWNSGRQPSQSSRYSSRSHTPHGQRKKKKKKPKKSQTDKDYQEYQAPPLPASPWVGHGGGKGSSGAAVAQPPEPKSDSKSEQKLKQVLSALKKHEASLAPELQQIVQESAQAQSQDVTKQLHSAVSRLGQAKKALQKLRASRQNLHHVWRAYIADSVTKWQTFYEQFDKQDTELSKQLVEALATVKTAEAGLESCKKAAKEEKDVEEISDTGMVEISEDENTEQLDANGISLKEGMNDMLKNLEMLKTHAESHLESSNKRPRLEDPHTPAESGDGAVPSLFQAAGQPFGKAGQ